MPKIKGNKRMDMSPNVKLVIFILIFMTVGVFGNIFLSKVFYKPQEETTTSIPGKEDIEDKNNTEEMKASEDTETKEETKASEDAEAKEETKASEDAEAKDTQ